MNRRGHQPHTQSAHRVPVLKKELHSHEKTRGMGLNKIIDEKIDEEDKQSQEDFEVEND